MLEVMDWSVNREMGIVLRYLIVILRGHLYVYIDLHTGSKTLGTQFTYPGYLSDSLYK
jgi:hypothetical protein